MPAKRPASRSISHRHTPNHCRSGLASDGGLPADQSLTDIRRTTVGAGLPAKRPASRPISHRHTPNHCGSGLAREGGLPADQSLTDIRRTTVGAGLPAKAAFQPTIFNSWPNILTPQPILPTPAISAPHTTPHLHDYSRSTTLQSRSPVAGQSPTPTRCRRCCGCGSFPRGRRVP
ncbi:hypothetical protein QF013_005103 [Pseudomonas laurylsulfatiphila]